MAIGGVYSSSNYSFGSIESIRQQAKEIGDRVRRDSDARKEEQEKTGLIEDPNTGDKVEISSLDEKTLERWNHRLDNRLFTPYEAMIGFMAADPHAEEVERSKELGAKFEKLQNKMLAGQKLTGEEKKFLRENYPEMASKAERMEQEAEQLEKRLRAAKSKDDSQRIYMEAKMNVLSELDKKDGSALFLLAAIDETYARHTGRGSAKTSLDILA